MAKKTKTKNKSGSVCKTFCWQIGFVLGAYLTYVLISDYQVAYLQAAVFGIVGMLLSGLLLRRLICRGDKNRVKDRQKAASQKPAPEQSQKEAEAVMAKATASVAATGIAGAGLAMTKAALSDKAEEPLVEAIDETLTEQVEAVDEVIEDSVEIVNEQTAKSLNAAQERAAKVLDAARGKADVADEVVEELPEGDDLVEDDAEEDDAILEEPAVEEPTIEDVVEPEAQAESKDVLLLDAGVAEISTEQEVVAADAETTDDMLEDAGDDEAVSPASEDDVENDGDVEDDDHGDDDSDDGDVIDAKTLAAISAIKKVAAGGDAASVEAIVEVPTEMLVEEVDAVEAVAKAADVPEIMPETMAKAAVEEPAPEPKVAEEVEAEPVAETPVVETQVAEAAPETPKIKPMQPASLDGPNDGAADSLRQIDGLNEGHEQALNAAGIYHFSQFVGMNRRELAWIDENIAADDSPADAASWRKQAIVISRQT